LLTVCSAAQGRAEHTVNKQHLKQSQAEHKAFNALAKRSFACAADAEAAQAYLQKTLKVVALQIRASSQLDGFKGKGRPSKCRKPDMVSYFKGCQMPALPLRAVLMRQNLGAGVGQASREETADTQWRVWIGDSLWGFEWWVCL
jgi:hypothetical protein